MLTVLFVHPTLRIFALMLLGFGLCFASLAQAAAVALVIASRGDVIAVNAQGERVLQRRSTLSEGDRIETGNNSQVQIRFIDGALLTLEHQTKLEISRFENNSANQGGQVLLRLIQGGLRNLTGKIAEQYPERYRVESAVASIGVRGTDFRVVLRDNKLAAGVYRGGIVVANKAGSLELGADRDFSFAWVTSPDLPPKGHLIAPSLLDDDSPQLRLIPSRDEIAQAIVRFNHDKTLGLLEQQMKHRDVPPTPTPTPTPTLPDWVNHTPLDRQALISTSRRDAQGNASIGSISAALSNQQTSSSEGLLLEFSNSGSVSMVEQAFILNGKNVTMNQVDDLPIYWGKWNGDPELLLYQSQATSPVTPLNPERQDLSWIYIEDEIINVDSFRSQSIKRLDFNVRPDIKGQWPLTSSGQDGALAQFENRLQLGINLDDQTVDIEFDLLNSDATAAWTRDSSAPSLAFTNDAGVIGFAGDAQFKRFSSGTLDGHFSFSGTVIDGTTSPPPLSPLTINSTISAVSPTSQELLLPAVMQLETNDQSQWSQLLFILEGAVPIGTPSNGSGSVGP